LVSIFGGLCEGRGLGDRIAARGELEAPGPGDPDAAGDGVADATAVGDADGMTACATTVTRDIFVRSPCAAVLGRAEAVADGEADGPGDESARTSENPSTVGNGIVARSGVTKTAPSTARSRLAGATEPGPCGCWYP
jgi:hypothetical protein